MLCIRNETVNYDVVVLDAGFQADGKKMHFFFFHLSFSKVMNGGKCGQIKSGKLKERKRDK